MDPLRVSSLSEEQVEASVQRAEKFLTLKGKGKEVSEALRHLFVFFALRSKDAKVSSELLSKIYATLEDETVPPKAKHLAAYLVWKAHPTDFPSIKENMRQLDKRLLSILLPLILPAGGYTALKANLQPLVQWYTTQEYSLRGITIPLLVFSARHYPQVLFRYLRALEGQMIEWLTNASTYSAKPAGSSSGGAMSNLFGGGKSNARPLPVTEWDGTACRDCFSVMNVSQNYSADQLPRKTPTDDSSDEQGPSFPLSIDTRFKDAVVHYCGRLLEQSKLVPPTAESRQRRLPDLALYEALRLIDAMSFLDPELVKKQFTAIKKIYSLTRPSLNKRSNAYIFLEILEYFLHHGEVVLHDPDPLLRQYFDGFLSENFMDPIISLETLWFCLRLKIPLVQQTNVLTLYFHSLLKVAAWHPYETIHEFNELIPTFASPTTYLELFHTLLDLPLLTATLEKLELERDGRIMTQGSSSSMSSNSVREMMSDKYGVLFHLLLRKESGVVINFWDSSQTLSLIKDFCREVEVTPRIRALADTVPQFLETFFKVVIEYADENLLLALLPVVFERIDQLFPFRDFETRVRGVLVRNVLAIFQKFPHFIVSLKTLILELIRDSHTPAREELVLSLCWAAGEYSSLNLTSQCTIQTLYDYDEALELFAFERMVMESGDSSSQVYNTRVMLVVISSLTKLASRWQPLASRVVLCLAKLLRHKSGLHPSVVERTFHSLALLKLPSIAASILDSPLPTEIPKHHIDANSSLPFLLRPVSAIGDGKIAKIHPFM